MGISKHTKRICALLTAAGCVAGVTACNGGSTSSASTSGATESITAAEPGSAEPTTGPPSTSVEPPEVRATPKDISDGQQAALDGYLTARENAVSFNQKKPFSWVNQAKPHITGGFYKALMKDATKGLGGVYGWEEAHTGGIAVKTVVSCKTNPEAPSSPTTFSAMCTVVDSVVDKHGKPYPLAQVPPQWPYAGKQPIALLAMTKTGNKWLVSSDDTGQAG